MEEKNELDALREKLLYKQKQGYDIIDVDERIKLEEYARRSDMPYTPSRIPQA